MSTKLNPAKITEARADRSFEAVATALECSHQTIRNWEAGKGEPDASQLAELAKLTEKPLEFFFEQTAA